MLTAQMNVEEVVHELMADVGWLESYQTMQAKVIGKELVRMGTLPATVVKQARSPKTKNEWTLLWTIRKDRPLIPFAAYYTTLQDEDGIYVYKPIISEDGLRIIVLQPHVFRRYRERLDLGDKLKPGQLIRRFMKLNLSGSFMPSGKYKDEPSWSLCTEEGVVLGIYISERVFLGRTFIKYDMAHEGRQADTLREGDENRRNLKLKMTSPRDMIKFAQEAERITKKSEQEQSQKNAG